MKERTKESRRRLNSLILLIAFTAIMLIVSTYAWFSTQKDVTISNLTGEVQVAEGLEISIDGETWSQVIDLEKVDIKTDAYDTNKNLLPEEMLPVSTLGETGGTDLSMLRGNVTNSIELSDIIACDETVKNISDAKYPGYIAFDIFLKNTSRGDTPNTLQLNSNSSVGVLESGGKAESGVQNTVRVGFALYNSVADTLATATEIISSTTGDSSTISNVAIWEPNSNDHVPYIVKNNNKIVGKTFADQEKVDTFALKKTAIGQTISNIYDWGGTITHLAKQNTLQTTKTDVGNYVIKEGVQDLLSATDGTSPFQLQPNKISRVRVYVWLEGQDVDCTNYASHGGGIEVDIGLVKDANVGSK